MKRVWLLSFVLLTAGILSACMSEAPSIEIEDAWARPGVLGENTAIYFHITSSGVDDSIIRADANPATVTELHRSTMNDDGTMSMVQQTDIPLPQDVRVELKPGGLHIMLMQLTEDLEPGDEVVLNLYFAKHSEMEINVPVKVP
jgi:copper(I)-binding protein